ncbi:MAG: CdaR family protein [Marinirhabdus sp.]|nr:CdaR family protein [Marinirhabdus sp.]
MAGSNKTFKSIKINMFFFFLLLAIVFWGLTKFSKENTANVEASIVYENLPENYLLGDDNLQEIDFYITSNGVDFLLYKMKKPMVTIDVSKYFNNDTKSAVLSSEELKEELSKQIGYNGTIRNLSENSLTIQLQGIQSKKIPVIINATVSYGKGFRAVDSIRANPDSIVVSGPSRALDSISGIGTQEVSLKNVSESVSRNVALMPFPYEGLRSKTQSVNLEQTVMEFAQKKLSVPITIQNLPPNTVIKLIPQRITITCVVPIEKFSTITETDFTVVCDFKQRNTEETFISPTLVEAPAYAKNVEVLPKKIDYLIFKK